MFNFPNNNWRLIQDSQLLPSHYLNQYVLNLNKKQSQNNEFKEYLMMDGVNDNYELIKHNHWECVFSFVNAIMITLTTD